MSNLVLAWFALFLVLRVNDESFAQFLFVPVDTVSFALCLPVDVEEECDAGAMM